MDYPVMSEWQVAHRWKISTKTVCRWRGQERVAVEFRLLQAAPRFDALDDFLACLVFERLARCSTTEFSTTSPSSAPRYVGPQSQQRA